MSVPATYTEAMSRRCDDCGADPGEPCHPACSSYWTSEPETPPALLPGKNRP